MDWVTALEQQLTGTHRKWATPGDLAKQLDPRTVQTPALDLIDAALVRAIDQPDGRLIISMPPQEGKTVRASQVFPIWALTQNPDLRIVTGSYGQGLATRNGRTVRNIINAHPDLGLTIADDNGAASEWKLAGRDGGMLSVGRGAGVSGRPADCLIIDDPLKDRTEADSKTVRNTCWDWWTDALSARLSPGAPVIVILTRWHEDDLAARLIQHDAHAGWEVLNIPAQADHNPAAGETDPLGREPGEYMVSARGRSFQQWENRRKTAGSRTWAALYQGRPAPGEGDLLLRKWWRTYERPLWVERHNGTRVVAEHDDLLMSWDLAFKETDTSDYVVGQVWMRQGANAYLLDQTRARMDFPATVQAVQQLAAKWPQATLKIIEDKANGPAVIAALRRTVPGIVAEEPQGSKVARVNAVAPLVEAGNVWLPSAALAPWVADLIEEAAAFPAGAHDDQVDALSQGLNRLVLQPLINTETVIDYSNFDDELAGYTIDPLAS